MLLTLYSTTRYLSSTSSYLSICSNRLCSNRSLFYLALNVPGNFKFYSTILSVSKTVEKLFTITVEKNVESTLAYMDIPLTTLKGNVFDNNNQICPCVTTYKWRQYFDSLDYVSGTLCTPNYPPFMSLVTASALSAGAAVSASTMSKCIIDTLTDSLRTTPFTSVWPVIASVTDTVTDTVTETVTQNVTQNVTQTVTQIVTQTVTPTVSSVSQSFNICYIDLTISILLIFIAIALTILAGVILKITIITNCLKMGLSPKISNVLIIAGLLGASILAPSVSDTAWIINLYTTIFSKIKLFLFNGFGIAGVAVSTAISINTASAYYSNFINGVCGPFTFLSIPLAMFLMFIPLLITGFIYILLVPITGPEILTT